MFDQLGGFAAARANDRVVSRCANGMGTSCGRLHAARRAVSHAQSVEASACKHRVLLCRHEGAASTAGFSSFYRFHVSGHMGSFWIGFSVSDP